jgi:dUTP pyrophosphatase
MDKPVDIEPYAFCDIPCGIAVKLPPGTWGMVKPRSSTFWKRRLYVHPGIIDNGYTGMLKIGVWNTTDCINTVNPGDALAQLILMPIIEATAVMVSELPVTDRGSRGFGSTDKKGA